MDLRLQRAPAGLLPRAVSTSLHGLHSIVQHPPQLPLDVDASKVKTFEPTHPHPAGSAMHMADVVQICRPACRSLLLGPLSATKASFVSCACCFACWCQTRRSVSWQQCCAGRSCSGSGSHRQSASISEPPWTSCESDCPVCANAQAVSGDLWEADADTANAAVGAVAAASCLWTPREPFWHLTAARLNIDASMPDTICKGIIVAIKPLRSGRRSPRSMEQRRITDMQIDRFSETRCYPCCTLQRSNTES
jgi:hypothetical protein